MKYMESKSGGNSYFEVSANAQKNMNYTIRDDGFLKNI